MNEQDLLARFFRVVAEGKRHKHYNHVVAKRKEYHKLVAGLGLDSLLKRFVRRETEKLFKQRVALTVHIVTSVCKNLLDVFYKVPRSNAGRRLIASTDPANKSNVKKLEDILKKFKGSDSFDDYMGIRWIDLNSVDPNAFTVIEWEDHKDRSKKYEPYPFEVNSDEALDFKYLRGELEYLISKDSVSYFPKGLESLEANDFTGIEGAYTPVKKDKKEGTKYTLYGKNRTYQLIQVDSSAAAFKETTEPNTVITSGKRSYVKLGKRYFEFIAFDAHNLNMVPAFRVGVFPDLATNSETCVNPLHAAIPFLLKTVKVNSELDLVATLMAMPKEVRYGDKCVADGCFEGTIADTETECKACEGTGVKPLSSSAQDAIVMIRPKSREEAIPLDDIVKYISPEVDIIKWQEEYIESLTRKARRVMFNSETFNKSEVQKTATGENLDFQNVYDTLYPFGQKFSKLWMRGVLIIAKITDLDKNLIHRYSFGKDMKMKSLDTLIQDLKTAKEIGNTALVRHIQDDISLIIYAEDPIGLTKYRVKQIHAPFSGKTEKEILSLMNSRFVSTEDKILHANYGKIFDELETSVKGFYDKTRVSQKQDIDAKVKEYLALVEANEEKPELGD